MSNENYPSTSWQVELAGREKQELVEAGDIGHEDLGSSTIYKLVPSSKVRLERQDQVSLAGTFICACGYRMPLKATVGLKGFFDAPSKHLVTCSQCWRQTMLVGETTGTQDSRKHWLLLIPTTGKPGAVEMPGTPSGLPELSIERIERIAGESEGLEEEGDMTLDTKPLLEGEGDLTLDTKPLAEAESTAAPQPGTRVNETQMPSEVIEELFEKRRIDPKGDRILAIAFLYEYMPAPYVWTGTGPDPYAVRSESDEIRQLRFVLSNILPGYQPHIIPSHLKIGPKTLITGRQFRPGETLDVRSINPMLAVMLADVLEDHSLLDRLDLASCSALSISGESIATGQARIALVVKSPKVKAGAVRRKTPPKVTTGTSSTGTELTASDVMGMKDRKDVKRLVQVLQGDSDPLLRGLAARVLGELGDPRAREALQNCLINDKPEVAAAASTALAQLEARIATEKGVVKEKPAAKTGQIKQEGCAASFWGFTAVMLVIVWMTLGCILVGSAAVAIGDAAAGWPFVVGLIAIFLVGVSLGFLVLVRLAWRQYQKARGVSP